MVRWGHDVGTDFGEWDTGAHTEATSSLTVMPPPTPVLVTVLEVAGDTAYHARIDMARGSGDAQTWSC